MIAIWHSCKHDTWKSCVSLCGGNVNYIIHVSSLSNIKVYSLIYVIWCILVVEATHYLWGGHGFESILWLMEFWYMLMTPTPLRISVCLYLSHSLYLGLYGALCGSVFYSTFWGRRMKTNSDCWKDHHSQCHGGQWCVQVHRYEKELGLHQSLPQIII